MTYQKCRYKGKMEKIPITEIDGQSYILLNDVRDRFPDVTYFTYNNQPIPFEHDSNHHRLNPLRIKANTEIIIDCHEPTYDGKVTPKFDDDMRQQISEIYHNSKQTVEDLAILKANTATILRQTFELTEFTTPRLFIVLPDYTPHYNPTQWLQLNYRLYFLCECENDDERHFAFHNGYELKRPREFLRKYEPYLTNMLTVVKCARFVSPLIVPHLTHTALGISALVKLSHRFHLNNLHTRIEWLDQILKEARKTFNISVDKKLQHLEGAELREIEFFLKKTDEHCKFGNLFRSVTNDGHVRWVCIQHHDEHYSKSVIKSLHEDFRRLGGEIKGDVALVEGKASEKFPGMLDILKQGLPLFSIVLKDSRIRGKHFHNLLNFVSQQLTIHNLHFENITVSSSRINKQRMIISKFDETLKNNDKLQIEYSFTNTLSELTSKTLDVISKANSRLIIQLKSQEDTPSLELTGAKETGFTLTINNSNEKYDYNYHTAIKNIFTKIPNITKIILHNGVISDEIWSCFFDFLTRNETLQELILDCQLTLQQTEELSLRLSSDRTLKTFQMPKLQGFEEIFRSLQTNTTLFELKLSNHPDLFQLDFIAKYLRQNRSLRILRLPKCQIEQNTDIEICENFFQNASLHALSLELVNTNCQESLERLVHAMDKNQTLETLELKGFDSSAIFHRRENPILNNENNSTCSSPTPVRAKSKKLLGLFNRHRNSHEEITTQPVVPIPTNHRKSVSVEPFYRLCRHPLLYKEIQEMTQNFELEELEVTLENHVEMKDIPLCMKSNVTLNKLRISQRLITVEEFQMLVEALRENRTITHLNLNEIKISVDNFHQIFDVLRDDQTLRVLEVEHCISHSDRDRFIKEVKQLEIINPSLKIVYENS